MPLRPEGDNTHVTYETRNEYVQMTVRKRLGESADQLQALRKGLASVLPMELAGLFTAKELEVLICGRREVSKKVEKEKKKRSISFSSAYFVAHPQLQV